MTKSIRPFLKWAGNKYKCLKMILPNLPKGQRLIEPFAGSGCVFLNTDFSQYLIAEENQDLIVLFKYLQTEGDKFIDYCSSFFIEQHNNKAKYYEIREYFNNCHEPRERSALFLYLNRHGFNGLCRYNSTGGYNVPFGSFKKIFFPKEAMQFFYQKSKVVEFIHSDFQDTFKKAKTGDVIYCDPPYSPLPQSSNFSSYGKNKFGEEDHIILAQLANQYAKKNIRVIISNHDTKFTRDLYKNSTIKSFQVNRQISCKIEHRLQVSELIAIF